MLMEQKAKKMKKKKVLVLDWTFHCGAVFNNWTFRLDFSLLNFQAVGLFEMWEHTNMEHVLS